MHMQQTQNTFTFDPEQDNPAASQNTKNPPKKNLPSDCAGNEEIEGKEPTPPTITQSQHPTWWNKLSKRQKVAFFLGISIAIIGLITLGLTLYFVVFRYSVDIDYTSTLTFGKPESTEQINSTAFITKQRRLLSPNKKYEGYLTTFTAGKGQSKIYGVFELHDKEAGMSLKYVNNQTAFLQVDLSRLFKDEGKSTDNGKRLLASTTKTTLQRELVDSYLNEIQKLKKGIIKQFAKNSNCKEEEVRLVQVQKYIIEPNLEEGSHKLKQSFDFVRSEGNKRLLNPLMVPVMLQMVPVAVAAAAALFEAIKQHPPIDKTVNQTYINASCGNVGGNNGSQNNNSYPGRMLVAEAGSTNPGLAGAIEEFTQDLLQSVLGCSEQGQNKKSCFPAGLRFYDSELAEQIGKSKEDVRIRAKGCWLVGRAKYFSG